MSSKFTQIAALLGLRIGEEFHIKDKYRIYRFEEQGGMGYRYDTEPKDCFHPCTENELNLIIRWPERIRYLPWTPRKGDMYYSFRHGVLTQGVWMGDNEDRRNLIHGMVYKNEAEAHADEDRARGRSFQGFSRSEGMTDKDTVKNHMPEVAKLLGVDLGEDFWIQHWIGTHLCKLTEDGLECYSEEVNEDWDINLNEVLVDLIIGEGSIVKEDET